MFKNIYFLNILVAMLWDVTCICLERKMCGPCQLLNIWNAISDWHHNSCKSLSGSIAVMYCSHSHFFLLQFQEKIKHPLKEFFWHHVPNATPIDDLLI